MGSISEETVTSHVSLSMFVCSYPLFIPVSLGVRMRGKEQAGGHVAVLEQQLDSEATYQ